MNKIARLLFCALGLTTSAGRLAAQQPSPEVERLRELVGLVADRTWYGTAPELLEGRLPAQLPAGFPSDVEVLGTLVHEGGFVAFLSSSAEPGEWAEEMTSELVGEGWEIREESFLERVGFVAERPPRPAFLCQGRSKSLAVSSRSRVKGGSVARLEYNDSTPVCDPTRMRAMRPQDFPIPQLVPPAGVTTTESPGMAMNHWARPVGGDPRWIFESGVTLETDRPLAELMDHYGSLLEAHGWNGGTTLTAEDAGLGTWEYMGDGGAWRALLLALRDDGRYELLLRVDGFPEHELPDEPPGR